MANKTKKSNTSLANQVSDELKSNMIDSGDDKFSPQSFVEKNKVSQHAISFEEEQKLKQQELIEKLAKSAEKIGQPKAKKSSKKKDKNGKQAENIVDEEFDKALKSKPNKKKGRWKKRFLKLGAISMLGVLTGCGLGYWYYNTNYGNFFDPNSWTPEQIAALYDNEKEIIAKVVGKELTEEEQNNWFNLTSLTPENLSASENALLALYNLSNPQITKAYRADGEGNVTATVGIKASQSVYGLHSFDGETYISESASYGQFAKQAHRSSMDKNKKMVTHIDGTTTSPKDITWTDHIGGKCSGTVGLSQNMTAAAYKDVIGGLPDEVNPYIISSKTVIDNDVEIKKVVDEEGKVTYSFTFQLKPVESTVLYVKQMKMVGGLDSYPMYEKGDITQTFTIDENWNLIEIYVAEHYEQVVGFKASCEGWLKTIFNLTL